MTLERYDPKEINTSSGSSYPIPFLLRDTGNMEEHRKSHLAELNLYQDSDPYSFTQGWPKEFLVHSLLVANQKEKHLSRGERRRQTPLP